MYGRTTKFIVDTSDKRLKEVEEILAAAGKETAIYEINTDYLQEKDTVFIFAPSTVLPSKLPPGATIFSYRASADIDARYAGVRAFCFTDDGETAVKNARYTAEGALALIISNTDKSLSELNVALLGGGRVSRAMLKILGDLDVRCTLFCRRDTERDCALSMGAKVLGWDALDVALSDFDVVVNSVPSLIINGGRLKKLSANCYVLDLASRPGGVDWTAAKEYGVRAEFALGLPGKYCPRAAACDICRYVEKRLAKEET